MIYFSSNVFLIKNTHRSLHGSGEIVTGDSLHPFSSGLLRRLDSPQRGVLEVERELHHIPEVIPAADVALRERSPTVYFNCLRIAVCERQQDLSVGFDV